MKVNRNFNFPILYRPRYETPLVNVARTRGVLRDYGLSSNVNYHIIESFPRNNYINILNTGTSIGELGDLDHIVKLIDNYKNKKDLLTDIPLPNEMKLTVENINSFYNKHLDYNCIVLSVFFPYVFLNLYIGLLAKLNNPNIDIIIGGPQINLSKFTRDVLRYFNVFDYIIQGEIEEAIRRYLNDELLSFDEVYCDQDNLPIPIYTDLEIRLFENIMISTSRSCINICSFCAGNYGKFRVIPIDKVIDVFKYYSKTRRPKVYINDNTINYSKKRILDLTDNLININNDLRIFGNFVFQNFNQDIINNLYKSNFVELYFGIDGLHLDKQKYLHMTKIRDDYLDILKELYNRGFHFELSYIYNVPGETREIFEYEFDIVKNLRQIFPDKQRVGFCVIPYTHSVGSDMYLNPTNYNIKYEYWERLNCSDELNEIVVKIPKYYYCDISKEEYVRRYKEIFEWDESYAAPKFNRDIGR